MPPLLVSYFSLSIVLSMVHCGFNKSRQHCSFIWLAASSIHSRRLGVRSSTTSVGCLWRFNTLLLVWPVWHPQFVLSSSASWGLHAVAAPKKTKWCRCWSSDACSKFFWLTFHVFMVQISHFWTSILYVISEGVCECACVFLTRQMSEANC